MALTAYWIRSPFPHAPLGLGVTAHSLDDAIAIIRTMEYGRYLPDDLGQLAVRDGVSLADLDQFVVRNSGPLAVRGMWYPFVALGVPGWAAERMRMGRPATIHDGVFDATGPG